MKRRSVAVVGVALLAATAGCGGFDGTTERPTFGVPETIQTETTGTTDRTTVGSNPTDVAPGLTPTGLRDPRSLAVAHRRYLTGRSVTVTHGVEVAYANGTDVVTDRLRLSIAANRTRYDYRRTVDRRGEVTTETVFSVGESGPVYRCDAPGTVLGDNDCRASRESGGYPARPALALGVEPVFEGDIYDLLVTVRPSAVRPVPTDRNGRFEVTTAESDDPTLPVPLDDAAGDSALFDGPDRLRNVRDVGFKLVVENEGVVVEMALSFRATYRDATVVVDDRYAFTAVDETTVERPDWADRVADAGSGNVEVTTVIQITRT
jgi:hypothetical protein